MESTKFNKHDTIVVVCSLVAVQTKRYPMTQLLYDFKREVGYRMPTFGHKNALEFLKSVPDMLEVTEEPENIYVKLSSSQATAYIGSTILKSGLMPEGESKLLSAEKKTYVKAEPQKKSLEKQTTNAMPVKKSQKKKSKYKIMKSASTGIKDEKEKLLNKYWIKRYTVLCYRCLSIEGKLETESVVDKCLSSIILKSNDISFINLSYYIEVGDELEVFVTEVCSPHRFFLQLGKFRNELMRLMNSMKAFYTIYCAKFSVEKYRFKRGQMCAAQWESTPGRYEWYRAMVVDFGDEVTKVLFIDYGTTTTVKNNKLKYLDRNFGELPVQAINGKIPSISPINGRYWSEDCCKTFYSLVFEEEVGARVVEIDSERNNMSVILSYGERGDLRVDNTLVLENLAVDEYYLSGKESLPSGIYPAIKPNRFLKPEDIGRKRKERIEYVDSD